MIRQCIDITTYPTALLYEKIDPGQDSYDPSLSNLSQKDLTELSRFCEQKRMENGGDDGGMSQAEILEQFELLKQMNGNAGGSSGYSASNSSSN